MEAHKVIQSIFHILGILVILGFLVLQAASCSLLVSAMGDSSPGAPKAKAGDSRVFGDKDAEVHFLQVPVYGVISSAPPEGLLGITDMSVLERVDRLIEHAEKSDRVDGLLLDIDSPGGAVDPSDLIYHKLMAFKARTGKPVIARLNGLAASGGFYVAVAADRIIAHPSTLTGSIGVIMQSLNYAGLFDKVGLDLVTLVSGPNKDLLNPGREMTDEEREILMSVIDEVYGNFVGAVAEGRGMEIEQVRELADGRIFTSRQALDGGLIDAIGYEEDLLALLREAGGGESVDVVRHKLPSKIWDLFDLAMQSAARHFRPESRLSVFERLDREPGLYYLWEPGS